MKSCGLSAFERIKSKKDFENIFIEGETTYSLDNTIRANFILSSNVMNAAGVKFAVAVSKKLGNAVWRNRIKRLIRESYRCNKLELIEECKKQNTLLEIIFSPQALNQVKNKHIGLMDIKPQIKEIIDSLKEKIR